MSQAAQGTIFSIAPQPNLYGQDNNAHPGNLTWRKMRVARSSIGQMQTVGAQPLELGGDLSPTGMFKDGRFFAGDVDIIPRAYGNFGWLLYALMGNITTDVDTPVAGVNRHSFTFNTDPTIIPWIGVRQRVPGRDSDGAADYYGEMGFDCLVSGLRLSISNTGQLAANIMMVGRDSEQPRNPSWTYNNATFEPTNSIPLAGNGSFAIAGIDRKIVGMEFTLANGVTSPVQERTIGSFTADTFTPLSRIATVRVFHQWKNADLLSLIRTGSEDGTTWSPDVWVTRTVGNIKALDLRLESAGYVGSTSTPHRLRLFADQVVWTEGKPMQMAGGGLIVQEIIGQIVVPDSASQDYMTVQLDNGVASYTWPSPPALTPSTDVASNAGVASVIDSSATLTHATAANLNGGYVMVSYVGDTEATNTISISETAFSIAGTTISTSPGALAIGDIDATYDGTSGVAFKVNLNTTDATPAVVEDLIQELTFNAVQGSDPKAFLLKIQVHDGVGGTDTAQYYVTVAAS